MARQSLPHALDAGAAGHALMPAQPAMQSAQPMPAQPAML